MNEGWGCGNLIGSIILIIIVVSIMNCNGCI